MSTDIYVMTHKKYDIPDISCYYPMLVGSSLNCDAEELAGEGYLRDDIGINISQKNSSFCELTGIYSIWKNYSYDNVAVVQYRRYFTDNNIRKNIISAQDIEKLLRDKEIIVPRQRNYFIETNYSQYVNAHNKKDIDETRKVIEYLFPEYLQAFDTRMSMTRGHRFNMFAMRGPLFADYCKWLFDIMFELEKRLDITDYDAYNKRVFGFIAERLLDVWIDKNNYTYFELPVYYTEFVNWPVKIFKFIRRKIKGGK